MNSSPRSPRLVDRVLQDMIWMEGLDLAEGGYPGLQTGVVVQEDGVLIERDVPVALRDGVTVYVDVFRPPTATDIPVILTLNPYGKHAPKGFDLFPGAGVPDDAISPHTVWEGPDPMWWAKRGYAVVNADSRGSWMSEGDLVVLSEQEGEDGYDLVEWAAALPWCNGKVGMTGVSYLAVIQWRIAATRPPHLAAINPWEGWSDCYREYFFHGGIPETRFVKFTQWSCRCGTGRVENLPAMHDAHLMLDDYNLSKSVPDLAVIDVPAYCVTDWGDHGLHTRGTIEAWREISSERKWLEVHGRKKWQYYYRPESLRRQKAFFDHFLKRSDDRSTAGHPCESRSASAGTKASSAPKPSGRSPAPTIAYTRWRRATAAWSPSPPLSRRRSTTRRAPKTGAPSSTSGSTPARRSPATPSCDSGCKPTRATTWTCSWPCRSSTATATRCTSRTGR